MNPTASFARSLKNTCEKSPSSLTTPSNFGASLDHQKPGKNDVGVSFLPRFAACEELSSGQLSEIPTQVTHDRISAVCAHHKKQVGKPAHGTVYRSLPQAYGHGMIFSAVTQPESELCESLLCGPGPISYMKSLSGLKGQGFSAPI